MTNNILPIKKKVYGRPFSNGHDPRRHMDGPPKGTNPLIALKKRALANHTEDIIHIIAVVMKQAKEGNEKSQSLVFNYFVTTTMADLTIENCNSNEKFDSLTNIPENVLENMRSNFIEALNKYSNDDSEQS
jgi:hypothetical protein